MRFVSNTCAAAILGAAAATGSAFAQDAVPRAELERMLAERDAVIIQLQQRMRVLEEKVAAGAYGSAATTAPATAGATGASAAPAPSGPGAVVVDLAAAERALERALVDDGTLLLPAWSAEIAPSVRYTNSARDFPAVSGGALATTTVERNTVSARVNFRLGLPWDSQLEVGVPVVLVDQDSETVGGAGGFAETGGTGFGLGDIDVGIAKTIWQQEGWLPDIVGRVSVGTGSGRRVDNGVSLGGGFPSVAGSLSFLKRQEPVVFFGTAGYRAVFEDRGIEPGNEIFLSAGLGLAISPETSVQFSVDNVFTGDFATGGVEAPGTDTMQAVFNAGISTILARDLLLSLNVGIGLSEDAPDYSFLISMPYRF